MTLMPQLERELARAARRRRTRSLRAVAITAGAALLAAAALLAPVLLDRDSPAPAGEPDTSPARPDTREHRGAQRNPPLESLLGVFRRERTPRDKANFTLEDLEASHDSQPGESPADSRRIDLPDGPVYLWRMTDGVCTSWGNCLKTGALEHLRVAVGMYGRAASRGRQRVVKVSGLVVDGIDQVQIGAEHSDQIVVPVEHNVFQVDLSRWAIEPTRILWREGGRWHRRDLPALGIP